MYALSKKDIPAAGALCADAFRSDPVWLRIFEDEPDFEMKFRSFFQIPVRHCLKYGAVWAPSEKLEGLAAWVPDTYADMSFLRIILSGALLPAFKMGKSLGKKMQPVFDILPRVRNRHMAGKRYRYLMVLGVRTALQGQGYGRQLLDALTAACDTAGEHLYLETETGENVRMYEHFGFTVLEKLSLPGLSLPLWLLTRTPGRNPATVPHPFCPAAPIS